MEQGPVENDTHGWVELIVEDLDPGDGTGVPYRLIVNRFKSSSPDSEDFIHDPLGALIRAQGTEGLLPGLELTQDWTVTTLVLNHHQTLSATHLHAMAAVDEDEKTVGVTLVKKRPRP